MSNSKVAHAVSRAVRASALVAVAACGPRAVTTVPKPTPDLERRVSFAVERARANLDSALVSGDVARVARLVDSSAILVVGDGREWRREDDIAKALVGERFGGGRYETVLAWSGRELCRDGAVYNGRYSMARQDSSTRTVVESGAFVMHWVIRDDVARAVHIVLASDPADARQRSRAPCDRMDAARFAVSRFEVSIMPMSTTVLGNTRRVLERDLRSQGWRPDIVRSTLGDEPGAPEQAALILAGGHMDKGLSPHLVASVRLKSAWWLEASWQAGANQGALISYNESNASLLNQEFSERETGLTLATNWRVFRVGVGPVLVMSDWRERYDSIGYVYRPPDPPIRRPVYSRSVDTTWSSRAVGALAHGSYIYAISRYFSVSASLRARVGTRSQFHGVPTHRDWNASFDGVQAGFAVGMAW